MRLSLSKRLLTPQDSRICVLEDQKRMAVTGN